jgi:energy-converting hydrogenase A subunit R
MSSVAKPGELNRVFISDCEGPISRNDNAFELASKFIPDGDRLFTSMSRYDDVLADVIKREGYKAGDTLKLILPFFKAYGVTNKDMVEYSGRHVLLIPGVKEMLGFIRGLMSSFIVSTSYAQYMHALCRIVDFPFESVYCTELDLDKYEISDEEKSRLRQLREEMIRLTVPEIPKSAQRLEDLPRKMQGTINRLDEIFWKEVSSMKIGELLSEVNPVGGAEKATSVKNVCNRLNLNIQNAMYVGDSITDVEAFRLVRKEGGLTVSFNGNNFAVREAEVAVLSENAVVTAALADIFNSFGKDRLIGLIDNWDPFAFERFVSSQPLRQCFLRVCRKSFQRVEVVTARNRDRLMRESSAFRKTVRGEGVGGLG